MDNKCIVKNRLKCVCRKRQRTASTSKDSPPAKKDSSEWSKSSKSQSRSRSRSRSRSLSPLSAKMAMQENKWHPPPTINTTSSYMPNVTPTISVPPPTMVSGYNYPYVAPVWTSPLIPSTQQVAPPSAFPFPPPQQQQQQPQGVTQTWLFLIILRTQVQVLRWCPHSTHKES